MAEAEPVPAVPDVDEDYDNEEFQVAAEAAAAREDALQLRGDIEMLKRDEGLAKQVWTDQLERDLEKLTRIKRLAHRVWTIGTIPSRYRRTIYTQVFDNINYRCNQAKPFFSDAFYIGPDESGPRMCMKIHPSETPKGFSFYYCLVKGRNDDGLVWPFNHAVKVQCLHDTEDRVIMEFTIQPPSDAAASLDYTDQPITDGPITEHSPGWGNQGMLSRAMRYEAGSIRSDRIRIRYIVEWVPYYEPALV
ncbi:TNF receptor-associated factor 2-like [Sycon ciliatum]|uniref:TNF receptor-associated factor 2-like n=1 Tax=Sycon ciliatum TaxID=27933 RepID=UPI0031F62355